MTRDEIGRLIGFYNERIIAEPLRGRVKLELFEFERDYFWVELWVDEILLKVFSAEEIFGYDPSRLIAECSGCETLREACKRAVEKVKGDRVAWSGYELLSAVEEYFKSDRRLPSDTRDPLLLMLAVLDKRTDARTMDRDMLGLEWLRMLYRLRTTGEMPKEFYERRRVVIDLAECNSIGEIYREIRVAMHWCFYYGEGLDALWDILTGMEYYGDDLLIKRRRTYRHTHYGREIDFTDEVDKICDLFIEACETEYCDISVGIEYVSQ